MQNPKKSSFHIVGGLTEIFFFCNFYQDLENEKKSSKKTHWEEVIDLVNLFFIVHTFFIAVLYFSIFRAIHTYGTPIGTQIRNSEMDLNVKIGCRIKHWSQYFNRLVWLTASSVFSFIYDDDEYWISSTMTFSVSHTWYYIFSISRINTDTYTHK